MTGCGIVARARGGLGGQLDFRRGRGGITYQESEVRQQWCRKDGIASCDGGVKKLFSDRRRKTVPDARPWKIAN